MMPIPSLNFATKSGSDGNMGGSTSLNRLISKEGISINFGDGGSAGAIGNKTLMAAAVGAGIVWLLTRKKP